MPISDFIRSVLNNVQYFGTNVAPLFSPNWAQIIEKRRQDEENQGALASQSDLEERKFQQQQQYQNAQIQDVQERNKNEAAKTLADLYSRGFRDVQGAPGGPGLNEDGASPSFGAGGGTVPPGTPNVVPQIPTALGILNGMQQAPSQGVNSANATTNTPTPAVRANPTGATSGGGGVVSPAVPTVFNILGHHLQYSPPDQTEGQYPVPDALKQLMGTHAASMKDINTASELATRLGIIGQPKPPAKEPNLAADAMTTAIQEVNPKGKTITDVDPDKRAAVLERARILEKGPTDAMKTQKDKLEMAKAQNELDAFKATKSPEAINNLVGMMKRNPDLYDEIKDKDQQGMVAQEWSKQTGMPLPTKLDADAKKGEGYARTTGNVLNRVMSMADDPTVLKRIGPYLGRLGQGEQSLGNTFNQLPDSEKSFIQNFRSDLNYLYLQEGKTIFGGRPPVLLINMLKSSSPNVNQVLPLMRGSFRAVQDFVNARMFGAEESRFGGQVRPWMYDRKHNMIAGQMVYNNAKHEYQRIKQFLPDGKAETE